VVLLAPGERRHTSFATALMFPENPH